MMQLSLLETRPTESREGDEATQKQIQRLKKTYSKQREVALTAEGRVAYNAAMMANSLKTEIERLEREAYR